MDEPRTHLPGDLWFEEEHSNERIGLLCTRNGDIRGSQWADTIFPMEAPRRHAESPGW